MGAGRPGARAGRSSPGLGRADSADRVWSVPGRARSRVFSVPTGSPNGQATPARHVPMLVAVRHPGVARLGRLCRDDDSCMVAP